MTITVETGSGSSSAQSYASVADADAWHAARGITVWAPLLTEEKEAALVRATAYMTQVYRTRWAGRRLTNTQALDWPRCWVPRIDGPSGYGIHPDYYPQDQVPREVRDACCELALSAAAGDLAPNIERLKQSVKIGPIETTYAANSPAFTRYRAVDNMLQPVLNPATPFAVKVSRS